MKYKVVSGPRDGDTVDTKRLTPGDQALVEGKNGGACVYEMNSYGEIVHVKRRTC